jgi:hypothetical protein
MLHDAPRQAPTSWWKRVGWLLLIWLLSVGALGLVAAMLRAVMRVAGLTA